MLYCIVPYDINVAKMLYVILCNCILSGRRSSTHGSRQRHTRVGVVKCDESRAVGIVTVLPMEGVVNCRARFIYVAMETCATVPQGTQASRQIFPRYVAGILIS